MPNTNRMQLHKTIVLVGLMGCGKTAIGKLLALELGVPFFDLDAMIEESANLSITEIFAKYGEAYFRRMELEAARKALAGEVSVLATGGGAFINPEIRTLIKAQAFSIWIRADVDVLLERVSRKNTRPLLENGNKAEILQELMETRYPVYVQADLTVDTGRGQHTIVLDRIIDALHKG